MRRLFLLIMIVAFAYISKPAWEDKVEATEFDSVLTKIEKIKNSPKVKDTFNQLYNEVNLLLIKLDESFRDLENPSNIKEENPVEKPTLTVPSDQTFSIYNIEMGDSKENLEQELGEAKRQSTNEYGVSWYAYHENYRNFLMVSYDENNRVNGLYTNQDLLSSSSGIEMGVSKEVVQNELGEPLSNIRKGLTLYQLQNNGEQEVYQVDGSYVTVFYDKHENDTVTAIQIIDESLEANKKNFYSEASSELKEGFEFQLFDLTNATRVEKGFNALSWDDQVRDTARKHSLDMAEQNYFSHTNLEGESPFDRMEEDQVAFRTAGENLAYGQLSSIFAHEGLMNSKGHRENILQPHYEHLGVGVAFNGKAQPYFTENFFSN
ncbi:CAP domain-containing protein [Rossellomorea aquimaris]|uniref:Cysteine-rich secretory family protein n=1 Tax=Rossellomorea aquimaris TaxID=189382 RepID=A0A366F080_9BACI|nr:CAP domain-containing protein [Rossellomorea aquimaris]RBP08053.1 cysteine-rich secretory family protein [Rossellomorea aquimaris]